MEKWLGSDVPKLGFGLMRLPTAQDNEIDFPQLEQMVDSFLEAGFTYFDTAYGYMGERSELAAGRALTGRHPRDKFLLATKMPLWMLKEKEDLPRIFATQLERTGAGYFDYYLLHNIHTPAISTLDRLDGWGFVQQKKAEGLIRHVGFSFHDTAEVLDGVLTRHPELEFVQLQLNYMDWDDAKIQAGACYEVARRHGKPVIIMEPVKGGSLAALNDKAGAALEAVRPGMSQASWAMRYAGSLDGVITVLSGMSTMDQMRDNIQTMADFEPLTEKDRGAVERVRAILSAIPTVPCTDCRYCMENCPQKIPIPAILDTNNQRLVYGTVNKGHYGFITKAKGKASDCIACGVCEGRCPQKIEIIALLKDCAEAFEQG